MGRRSDCLHEASGEKESSQWVQDFESGVQVSVKKVIG